MLTIIEAIAIAAFKSTRKWLRADAANIAFLAKGIRRRYLLKHGHVSRVGEYQGQTYVSVIGSFADDLYWTGWDASHGDKLDGLVAFLCRCICNVISAREQLVHENNVTGWGGIRWTRPIIVGEDPEDIPF